MDHDGVDVEGDATMNHGINWYELMTTDLDAASAFYAEVVGWTVHASTQPDEDYRQFTAGDVYVGGMMTLPPEAAKGGTGPQWNFYVNVGDADDRAKTFQEAGGALHMPGMDVPGVGRFCFVADPQGANLYVMTPASAEGQATSHAPMTPGHGGWHELHASDGQAATEFYTTQFGWDVVEEMDMGPAGTYALFNFGTGEPVGGIMTDADAPRPFWLTYFNVTDIDAAAERVRSNGGAVVHGPQEVPGGAWIINATDPQGALFALTGSRS